jgi:tetrahydromethanopterin S-methyltransferase subunit G
MSDTDIIVTLQTVARQLGTVDARLDELNDQIKSLVSEVHIGNGHESVLTRLARLEEQLEQVQATLAMQAAQNRDLQAGKWKLFAAFIAAGGTIIAAITRFWE